MTVCNAEQTQTETCVVGTTHVAKLCCFSWLCLGTVVAPSAHQPNMEQAMDSWDDTDLVMDVARLRRSAAAKKVAGNTSRPNSTKVGIVQGKRPGSASIGLGVEPSATQAQKSGT